MDDEPVTTWVTAVCPTCPLDNNLHTVYMAWTGRGRPRIYCDKCKKREAQWRNRQRLSYELKDFLDF